MPLHFSSYASRYIFLMSSLDALFGRFTVLLTAASTYFWKTACILTCHSGLMSNVVLKTTLIPAGTSFTSWMLPLVLIFIISDFEYIPFSFVISLNKGFDSR